MVVCFVNIARKWIIVSLLAWRIGLELGAGLKVVFCAPATMDAMLILHCHTLHPAIHALTMYVKFAMLIFPMANMDYAICCTLELTLNYPIFGIKIRSIYL